MNKPTLSDNSLQAPQAVEGVAPQAKRAYAAPRLEVFGKLTRLTQNTTNASNGDGGATMMASDLLVKENIVRIDTHPLGFGLYLFDYKPDFKDACGHGRRFGVLAQEVETVVPAAVSVGTNGFRQVNYTLLGIEPRVLH